MSTTMSLSSLSRPGDASSKGSLDGWASKAPKDRLRERLNSELLSAVCRSDVEEVKRLLSQDDKPTLNAYCQETNSTSLHIAAMRGDVDMIDFLVAEGAKTAVYDSKGHLPLHLAVWEGNINTTKALLEASPELVNAAVKAPTEWAPEGRCGWEHDHKEVTSMMSVVSLQEGSTALHVASTYCQRVILKYLLGEGASVRVTDSKGRTALDVAGLQTVPQQETMTPYCAVQRSSSLNPEVSAASKDAEFFRFPSSPGPGVLTPYSIPFNDIVEPAPVNANVQRILHDVVSALMARQDRLPGEETDSQDPPNPSGGSLNSAILSNDLVVMTLLHENHVNLYAFDSNGDTPLHFAVRNQKLQPLKLLVRWLEAGKIDMKNRDGITALHLAVGREWPEGVGFLLESGASVQVQSDEDGETVLHMAARLHNPRLMEELLMAEGALEVVNVRDEDGFTALIRAVQKSSKVVVELLVHRGNADVTIHFSDGRSILHYAVTHSNSSVLKYLVSLTSCRSLIDEVGPPGQYGTAPLHEAADEGNVDFVQILLNAGANSKLYTAEGPRGHVTALHLAVKKGFTQTAETILKKNSTCLDAEDDSGWKPIHTACAFGHGNTVVALIKFGADLSDPVNFHGTTETALDMMVLNVPKSAELLESLLDSYIEVPARYSKDTKFLNNPSYLITLNFECLLSSNDPSGRQLTFLNSIVNTNEPKIQEILLHPLIETFLYIKWSKLWKFFAALLFFYFLHTLALTAYTFVVFIPLYKSVQGSIVFYVTFLATLVPITVAEALHVLRLDRRYWMEYESWIKWSMILTSGVVGIGSFISLDAELMKHVSVAAVLTSWIELLFIFSRFKYWGLDVLMFEKVIENVLTVLSKFVFIFLGFMFALMIHFQGSTPFANVWDSLCQIVVMIVELNYGGLFSEASTEANGIVGRLLFVAYMIFVALAMMNLTIGLAVSDIASLEKQGRVEKLIKRTSFLSFLETLVYDERVLCLTPPRLDKSTRNSFRSVDLTLTVYPNKPGGLPPYLKTELMLKTQHLDSPESLTTLHFDRMFALLSGKIEAVKREIEDWRKSHPPTENTTQSRP